jgi:leucyl-tRNA synthetase
MKFLTCLQLCADLKIASQNDKEKLAEAKEIAYTKGFYEGIMIIGEFAGQKVPDAKLLVRDLLMKQGLAMLYWEPEKQVISRSGDECVVALTDQWYLDYGEADWRALTQRCLAGMQCYAADTRNEFELTLKWLKEWGCSRSFGLGTRMPWDAQYLIESLSDSTIYMAYYTVAHLLQGGVIDGSVNGPLGISASDLTDEVWEFVLLGAPVSSACKIAPESLAKLRGEFTYWYPVDLRTSGRDLVKNHLTFWMYNHTAIFPEAMWPKAVRTNGHLQLNNAKMAKQTGNFLTLKESIFKFSADAMRLVLAEAGDSNEDANFNESDADKRILWLTTELNWVESIISGAASAATVSGPIDRLVDRIFENKIRKCVNTATAAYEAANYNKAVVAGFFEMQLARDEYRTLLSDRPYHKDLLMLFIRCQTLLLAPITPHLCEHLWHIMGNSGSVTSAPWPVLPPVDLALDRMARWFTQPHPPSRHFTCCCAVTWNLRWGQCVARLQFARSPRARPRVSSRCPAKL